MAAFRQRKSERSEALDPKKLLLLALTATLIIFLTSKVARGEPMKGQAILGLAMQDVPKVARELDEGQGIAVLQGTFGDVIPALHYTLKKKPLPFWEMHLGNGSCERMNRCAEGEIASDNFVALTSRIKRAELLRQQFPTSLCYLSPRLEYPERRGRVVKRWIQLIRTHSACTPVLSPIGGYVVKGVLIERHGNRAKGDVISNDGESFFDSDSPNYIVGGRVLVQGWIDRFNLRVSGEKSFTSPRLREAQASVDNIIHVKRLLRPEHPQPSLHPKICQSISQVQKPELWKTNAEDYNSGDKREDRPLFISPTKFSRPLSILSQEGKRIGCASYYGPYSGGGFRHYVGSCSGHSAVQLMNKNRGREWGYLEQQGKCELVNFIRRKGYFRS